MIRFLVAASLMSIGLAVWAETHYFVVVGSYGSLESAQAAKAQAAAALPEPYVLLVADTARGTVHRVLAGPYPDRERAAEVLEKARAGGILDAWLLAEQTETSVSYPAAGVASDIPPQGIDELEDRLLSREGARYDEPQPADDASEAAEPDEWVREAPDRDASGGQVLIEEAPPGYNLHRLRRAPTP